MIEKINQSNKQKKKKKKKKTKQKQKQKKGPFHWLAVDCTIFHNAKTLLFQNDCSWNGKSHSLSTRPVAMIYFEKFFKTVDLLTKKLFELTFLGP